MECIIFSELVAYIGEQLLGETVPIFKLSDLANLYNECLLQVGIVSRAHSTWLKGKLLSAILFLSPYSEGWDIRLTADKNVGVALKQACNYDDEAAHLVKAAQIIWQVMFSCQGASSTIANTCYMLSTQMSTMNSQKETLLFTWLPGHFKVWHKISAMNSTMPLSRALVEVLVWRLIHKPLDSGRIWGGQNTVRVWRFKSPCFIPNRSTSWATVLLSGQILSKCEMTCISVPRSWEPFPWGKHQFTCSWHLSRAGIRHSGALSILLVPPSLGLPTV